MAAGGRLRRGELPPNYTKPGDTQYPAVPCSIEKQTETLIEAIDEGCAATNVHPRDPEDCLVIDDVYLFVEIQQQ